MGGDTFDKFQLVSNYRPTGDQPQAIQQLVEGLNTGMKEQTLLGVTGSGKTFTMANVIAQVNRPTLVLAHNKTLAYLVIIGFVNAVNLTDGLDGLCSSVTFVAMLGYMTISTLLGYYMMGIFGAAMAGGCAGFLFWNFYPAKVFMGDTGSMFLGGAVVTAAFGIGRPELLFLLGIIYLIEAGSVMLQVSYFKLTHGKRIFKMSPIHHHFELCGWSEVRIDGTFAFITLVGVLLGFVYVYLN